MSRDRKSTLLEWAERIRAIAGSAPPQKVRAGTFSDEAGHRRSVDAPLLAWRRRADAKQSEGADSLAEPDVALWWALSDSTIDPAAVLRRFDAPRTRTDEGSLLPASISLALEVWTEREFAALHALWWLARRRDSSELRERLEAAVAWHIENIQPDNATGHPWALQVFVDRATCDHAIAAAGARLFAETLLHNCRVALGYPDALSREILADAADALVELADDAVSG